MNLIGDPWIPVVFQAGDNRTVGLGELYSQAENIRDLALAPPQRIAVMRLLICITQAALDGPSDIQDWKTCVSRIVPASLAYLESRKTRFDLFGETPFMQIKDLEIRDEKDRPATDKLDFRLASGNNKTLHDQDASPDGRMHPSNWAALHLLTFLNFSTGGKVGQARWNGEQFSASAKAAPVLQAAQMFVRGQNLCETIRLNLLTKEQVLKMPNGAWGQPVWDCFPTSSKDKTALQNATNTYLGRLVPLTRLIKIDPHYSSSNMTHTHCIIGPPCTDLTFEGLPAFREPSTTLIVNSNEEYVYLTVSVDKHIWRDLGAVLVLNQAAAQAGGPLTLQNLQKEEPGYIDLWIGGLIPSKADIEDAVEWNLSIPGSALQGDQLLLRYQNSVALAEISGKKLVSAVYLYLDELKAYTGKDQTPVRRKLAAKAATIYWQALDQRYGVLLENRAIDDDWRRIIRDALSNAYTQSCPHETPRQTQAFVEGRKRLRIHELLAKGD